MTSKALGLIETIGLPAAIEAADAASKSANVTLLGYENTRGGGLITVKIVGDVGAVKAAVSAGSAAALRVGKVATCLVIPRPHAEIEALIHHVDRGRSSRPAAPEPARSAFAESVKPRTETLKKSKTVPKAARPAAAAAPGAARPKQASSVAKPGTTSKPKSVLKAEKPAPLVKLAEPQPQSEPAPSPEPAVPDEAQPIATDQPEEPTTIE